MKPFNLEEAVNGEPVVLRNGSKAYVLADLRDLFNSNISIRCLVGVSSTKEDSGVYSGKMTWRYDGTYYDRLGESDYDIVGMYEEPPKSQEEILEEAWRNKGKIVKTDAGFITVVAVVGKTADGEYIVRNPNDGSLDEISVYGKLNWRPYEEPKGPLLNPKLALLHLPKPIKPKEGEDYWRISKVTMGKLYVERARFSYSSHTNRNHSEQGNCFSSALDAQAWVDALNYARTGKVKIE